MVSPPPISHYESRSVETGGETPGMARRKRGNPIDGWLVIDKPVGVGSTDMVSKARWALQAQKAGHAGTLDPLASGVLAIAFGEATKTVPYVQDSPKHYRFTVRWGGATATDDLEGDIIHRSDIRPDPDAIRAALEGFRGTIMQVPPIFSAIKVDGARSYDLARAGEVPELAARPIDVLRLELIETPDADHAVLEMTCGKGGYVRSIARDLGEVLGCYGHVSELRRVAAGPFMASDGIDPAILDAVRTGEATVDLLPVSTGLAHLPCIAINEDQAARLRNGNPAQVTASGLQYGESAWAALGEEAVAVGTWRAGSLHPTRVFVMANTE